MSYCVNCGVKLKRSEKSCPLCNTVVINPNMSSEDYEPVYPDNVEKIHRINFKYISKLVILFLLILSFIVVLCDFITSRTISWSIYVVSTTLYIGCHLSYIIYKKKYIPIIIELISTELFIFSIAILNNGLHWYLYLVFPFIFIIWGYISLCIYLLNVRKGSLLRRIVVCFLFSSVALMVIEGSIDLYKYRHITYNWSIYAILPIVIISIIVFILSYNRKIVEEIKQRIFI